MVFQISIDELSAALSSITAVSKKLPAIGKEPPAGIVCQEDGTYSLCLCHEEVSLLIPLKTMSVVGNKGLQLVPYSGKPPISEESVIGIADIDGLAAIIKKTGKKGNLTLSYQTVTKSSSAKELLVTAPDGGEYHISCANPRMLCSLFGALLECNHDAFSLDGQKAAWLIDEIASMSDIIEDSVTQPAFGCVCLSSEQKDANSCYLRVSATSNLGGYTIVRDADADVQGEFEALIDRRVAASLKGAAKLKADGTVSVRMDMSADNPRYATRLSMSCDSFSLWVRCTGYAFPFQSLRMLIGSLDESDAVVELPQEDLSASVSVSVSLSHSDSPVVEISILDGGVARIEGKDAVGSRVLAKNDIVVDSIDKFPADKAQCCVPVDAKKLAKLLNRMKTQTISVMVTDTERQRAGKLGVRCTYGGIASSIVLIQRTR